MGKEVVFVLCGDGEKRSEYMRLAKSDPHIILPGRIGQAEIYWLLHNCKIGLNPTPDRSDYHASLNNKTFEYLSGGLPILSSPTEGVLFDLLRKNNCGDSYHTGQHVELANLIGHYYENPSLLDLMAKQAKQLFQKKFRADRIYNELVIHLEQIVSHLKENS
jgi:glycosyltransferase involved in cell wall biosynthesis